MMCRTLVTLTSALSILFAAPAMAGSVSSYSGTQTGTYGTGTHASGCAGTTCSEKQEEETCCGCKENFEYQGGILHSNPQKFIEEQKEAACSEECGEESFSPSLYTPAMNRHYTPGFIQNGSSIHHTGTMKDQRKGKLAPQKLKVNQKLKAN